MALTKDYSQNLGYWIKQYSKLANQAMEGALRPYGIGRTQWYALFYIHYEKVLSQRDLQNRLGIESATLTKVLSSLIRRDIVAQTMNEKDRRNKDLMLTPKGMALWELLPDPIDEVKSKALRNIPEKDIARTRRVLEAAVRNLKENRENRK